MNPQIRKPSSMTSRLSVAGIRIPKQPAVQRFLSSHRPLAKLIVPICQKVRNRFDPTFELSLEHYREPEIDDEYLTLYVRQDQYDISIMDRIDSVREALAEDLERVAGLLLITTDFAPPRRSPHATARVRGSRRSLASTRSNGRGPR
jgi:hypothetical protein